MTKDEKLILALGICFKCNACSLNYELPYHSTCRNTYLLCYQTRSSLVRCAYRSKENKIKNNVKIVIPKNKSKLGIFQFIAALVLSFKLNHFEPLEYYFRGEKYESKKKDTTSS